MGIFPLKCDENVARCVFLAFFFSFLLLFSILYGMRERSSRERDLPDNRNERAPSFALRYIAPRSRSRVQYCKPRTISSISSYRRAMLYVQRGKRSKRRARRERYKDEKKRKGRDYSCISQRPPSRHPDNRTISLSSRSVDGTQRAVSRTTTTTAENA